MPPSWPTKFPSHPIGSRGRVKSAIPMIAGWRIGETRGPSSRSPCRARAPICEQVLGYLLYNALLRNRGHRESTPDSSVRGGMMAERSAIPTFKNDPVFVLFLALVTCGLYLIYWNIKTAEVINAVTGRPHISQSVAILSGCCIP